MIKYYLLGMLIVSLIYGFVFLLSYLVVCVPVVGLPLITLLVLSLPGYVVGKEIKYVVDRRRS